MAYKLVGYYENWAQYRPEGKGKCLPDQIDPSLLTHINFAFGFFGFITRSVDPKNPRLTGNYKIEPVEWNDQTVLYPALQKLKQKNPNLKTLLSIGGWSFNDPQDTNGIGTFTYKLFSQMASSAAGRKEFIDSVIAYAHKYGFDGIDLDWEYPGDRTRGGTDSDYDNFLALLKEFRSAINNDGQKLLLTIASPAIKKGEAKTSEQFFAWLAQCAAYLDWLNVMTYDYHGAFPDDKVTGVNAPLLQDSTPGGTFSVRHTVETYLAAGIPKEKMVLGMPTYGRTFKVTSPLTDTDNGPGKPYSGPGDAGKATQTPGFLAYYEILERLSNGDLKRGWDKATLTPYAYSKNGEWITYDDAESLGYKVSYLIEKDLAGAMIWAIDDDDFFNAGSLKQENVSRALVSDPIFWAFALIVGILGILLRPETRPALPNTSLYGWLPDQQLKTDEGDDFGTTGPGALAEYNGLLWCIHPGKRGTDDEGYLWYTVFDGSKWSKDQQLKTEDGGVVGTYGSPILAVFDGKLWCIHRGGYRIIQRDHEYLWFTVFDGSKWSKDQPLNTKQGVGTSAPAGLAAFNNQLYCIHTGGQNNSDDAAYLWYTVSDGNISDSNTRFKDQQLKTEDGGVVGTYGSPALAVFNGKLWCIHRGGDNIHRDSEYLWHTVFDGKTWSKDKPLNDKEGVGTTSPAEDGGADKFAPVALAVFDGKFWCIHQGGGRGDDKDYLWYTFFDGNKWSTDQKVSYPISASESAFVKIKVPAALGVYNNQLFCTHEVDGYLSYFVVSANSQSGGENAWIEARGANSYCYYALNSSGTKGQKIETSKTIIVDAGAPFLYAVVIKNEDLVDFPEGAMLTIQAPNGTVYNQESNRENLLVMMSGSSLRSLIVKDPIPGFYRITLTVPAGVEFYLEFATLPSKDVFDTITNTSKQPNLKSRESQQLQKRELSSGLSKGNGEWVGTAAIALEVGELPNWVWAAYGLFVATAIGIATSYGSSSNDDQEKREKGNNAIKNTQGKSLGDVSREFYGIAGTTSKKRKQQQQVLNLLTWNMQGANWNDAATSPWTFVSRLFTSRNFSGLNLDVCCLQECGSPPAGSASLEMENIGGIQGFNSYLWAATLQDYLYILFYPWDTGAGRVNLAIVSRLYPNDRSYFPGNLRPLVGISIVRQNDQGQTETHWYFTIHASARGGGDAASLVEQVQQSINQSWVVAGDFNQDPRILSDRLQQRNPPVGARICPPSAATHPANNPQRQLDYAVRNQNEGAIEGEVFDERATGGTFYSDHRAVFYRFSFRRD